MLCLVLLSQSTTTPMIAYVRDSALYVFPCDRAGWPLATRKQIRVCSVMDTEKSWTTIAWTPKGQIVLQKQAREPKTGSIWLVNPLRNAHPRKLADGYLPSFSPDGREMAYQTDEMGSDVIVENLAKRTKRKVESMSGYFAWTPDGKRAAFFQYTGKEDLDGDTKIVAYPSLKLIASIWPEAPTTGLEFSPDGKYFAVHQHLSRPKLGHVVFSIATAKKIPIPCPNEYLPPIIDDWSQDNKLMLCAWRIVNPQNEGTWIKEYVGLVGFPTGPLRRLAIGNSALFSPDDLHALYMTDHRTGTPWNSGDLMWSSLDGMSRRRLATNVSQFAVFRSGLAGR